MLCLPTTKKYGLLALLFMPFGDATPLKSEHYLRTTTINVEGTPAIVINEIVATTTVTVSGSYPNPTQSATSVISNQSTGYDGSNQATPDSIVEEEPSPASTGTASTILIPAVHPNKDLSRVDNLKKSKSAQLFYSQYIPSDESGPGAVNGSLPSDIPIATIKIPVLAHPVVQLENSGHIASFSCSSSSAKITFSSQRAFNTALADWHGEGNFIIITYDPSCGDGHGKNERNFVLVTSINPDKSSLSIVAKITHISFAEATGGDNIVHVDIGKYTPSIPTSDYPPTSDLVSKRSAAYTKDFSKSISLNNFPSNAQTQWGSAYSIYKNEAFSTFCVGCGISGTFIFHGSFSLTFAHGFTVGNLNLNGNLHGVLQFGIEAQTLSKTFKTPDVTLLTLALSPLSIPGFVTLGPQLSIAAGAALTVGAAGSLLAGVSLDWPAIAANLALSDISQSTSSGFTPQIVPVFQARGNLNIAIDAYLPIRIEVGISILDGKFKKSVALVEKPGISVTAAVVAEIGKPPITLASTSNGEIGNPSTTTAVTASSSHCTVNISANINNLVELELLGEKRIDIATWTSPSINKCII